MWTQQRLGEDEVLAHRELRPATGRGVPPSGDTTRTAVRCGRPLIYPVSAAELPPPLRARADRVGTRYAGALFAFDLEPPAAGRRYTGARFEVALTAPASRAVRLAAGGDELGLVQDPEETGAASPLAARTVAAARTRPGWLRRLAGRRDTPRAWTSGVNTPSFGWLYDDPGGRLLIPDTHAVHALLELPTWAVKVPGALTVQVEISGPDGREKAVLGEAVTFDEPLTGAGLEAGAAVRLCMAADVVGYSGRRTEETARLQHDLVTVLGDARRAAGINEGMVDPQPQGDGQFTVLPVGIDESVVIPALLRELGAGLAARNRGVPLERRMRLRVALHRGLIRQGANGWVGTPAIAVHRLLDSPPLRAAVRDHPAAGYALAIPDVLYRDVLVHAEEPPAAGDFQPMTVDLPEKGFTEQSWIHVGPYLGE
ncbi:hypothetical protein [Actinoplanes sp. NPDC051851]|uniref:hypothetical protein n=1 Tax=Actinoplanes sp. NPDC051851 TaxID=3154753 RepID=UPI0034452DC9